MKTRLEIRAVVIAALMLLTTACAMREGEVVKNVELENSADITDELYSRADSVLHTLGIRGRIGQLIMPAIYSRNNKDVIDELRKYVENDSIGGVVLLKGSIDGAKMISDTLRSMSCVIPFVAIDAETGLAMRLENAVSYPSFRKLGEREVSEEDMFDYGSELARQARKCGINMILGPVLDVCGKRKALMWQRSLGDNPQRVSELGVAFSQGLESGGIISVAKHFPGHGDMGDSHKKLPEVRESEERLDSVALLPFKNYINSGMSAIMTGHLSVPVLGDSLPASVSGNIMTGLLRNSLGFNGLIITDAMNMGGASGHKVYEAIAAGADIVLAPTDTSLAIEETLEAIERGEIDEDLIAERCRRVLFYKMRTWDSGDNTGNRDNVDIKAEKMCQRHDDVKKKL